MKLAHTVLISALAAACSSNSSLTPDGSADAVSVDAAGDDAPSGSAAAWDGKELPTDPDLPSRQVVIPPVPSGPATFTVTNEATFRAALSAAALGDKIELANSFTVAGPVTLPAKPAGTEWITIYSAGWDTAPPVAFGENSGNVAHVLPSTPMFTITTTGNGAFDLAPAAHHYHFVGVGFAYASNVTDSSGLARMYVQAGNSESEQPHHIILDRCLLRGSGVVGGANHVRGVIMNADDSAVHQSYLDGFLNNNSDAQAIAGWSSHGPHRVTNNFLEGASETLIFGGAPISYPGAIPSDIEIRFNHMYKRKAWLKNGRTKNLFELKFARRVLVESNILENYTVDQQNAAVNIKVNPAGSSPDGNGAETAHVTFRYNRFRGLDAGAIKLASAVQFTGPAIGTHDILISHNYADGDINPTDSSFFLQVLGGPDAMSNLLVRHNTFLGGDNACISIQGTGNVTNFVYTDNICSRGQYGVKGGGVAEGTASLETLAPSSYTFAGNVLVGAGNLSGYPTGNTIIATIANLMLAGWNPAGGSDLTLTASSPAKTAGVGGGTPGVDQSLVDMRLVGVAYSPAVP